MDKLCDTATYTTISSDIEKINNRKDINAREKSRLRCDLLKKAGVDPWAQTEPATYDKCASECKIPVRYRKVKIDEFVADTEGDKQIKTKVSAYIENAGLIVQTGKSMFLLGAKGRGKTWLGYAIIRGFYKNGFTGELIDIGDFFQMIKESFGDSSEKESRIIARYANMPILVIDEVGVQFSSDFEKRAIYDLVNKRYKNSLPTVIISNLTMEGLEKVLGERVIDRLLDNFGEKYVFVGPSRRRGAA